MVLDTNPYLSPGGRPEHRELSIEEEFGELDPTLSDRHIVKVKLPLYLVLRLRRHALTESTTMSETVESALDVYLEKQHLPHMDLALTHGAE